jgi:D-alanyl-lipoteichoic acid acyltransferase DltB (MBOAT superfamily)
MLFNSFEFAILLLLVFIFYWTLKRQAARNITLLIASYIFYGFWDWRFLSLIFLSSLTDFLVGKSMDKQDKKRNKKVLLGISLFINLGCLGFFKYFNFFTESLQLLMLKFGIHLNDSSLDIILPVGISFYTFQTLSYTIDIYREKLKPTTDIIAFFTFVAFFPQLVAGPIERAARLLPQFQGKIKFDRKFAEDGLKQMLWGFFKKIVIADNAALIVNEIFSNYTHASPAALFTGIFLFSFQIYADFSGYSDIAIGTAKLFGIRITTNFRMPYFASGIREFWRRWHISLSTWFRDYVYIPLGGSKNGRFRHFTAIFATFLLSGLWHGANFTFLFWGLIHALLYCIEIYSEKWVAGKFRLPRLFLRPYAFLKTGFVFFIVMIAWVFFRSEKISGAFLYINGLVNGNETPTLSFDTLKMQEPFIAGTGFIFLMLIAEWVSQNKPHPLSDLKKLHGTRYLVYLVLILIIFLFAPGQKSDFIYFQF